MVADQALCAAGVHVARHVVDEQGVPGVDAEAVDGDVVDARVGLDYAFPAGHHHVAEMAGEGVARLEVGVGLGRIVGQRVDRHAARGQRLQGSDRSGDGSDEGFLPAVAEGGDQVGVVGIARGEQPDAVGERPAPVMFGMPVDGDDVA